MRSRSEVVSLAVSWLGKNEADGSYKSIIDIYNSFEGPLPRGVKMKYSYPWCACTWSAIAIALGYTDTMPIEISCGKLIENAKKMGCWVESDDYVPSPGDAILYDWDDNGRGDDTGWPEHVGIIDHVDVTSGYMTVIEGNYDDAVKKRTISINGKFIRGFITPRYNNNQVLTTPKAPDKDIDTIAREVIVGLWGSGAKRRQSLEEFGYDYTKVQARVNEILNTPSKKPSNTQDEEECVVTTCYAKSRDRDVAGKYVTTANVYCRNDAGTNKRALCLIPKGTEVRNYGFYTVFKGVKWLLINVKVDGVKYTGFSSGQYLSKVI